MKTLTIFSRNQQQQFAKHCKLCQLCKGRERDRPQSESRGQGVAIEAQRNFDVEEIVTGSSP